MYFFPFSLGFIYFVKIFFLGSPLLSNRVYFFLFSLLGLVYIAGLFVPLMDNDSGHHARYCVDECI